MSLKGKAKFSTDELKKFYFSKATNFDSYKKKDPQQKHQDTTIDTSDVNISVGSVDATRQIPTPADTPQSAQDSPAVNETTITTAPKTVKGGAAGSGIQAVKHVNTSTTTVNTSAHVNGTATADSVSPDYIVFLRQQQDLVKAHNAVDDVLNHMLQLARDKRGEHDSGNEVADELLNSAEGSTNWNWKSKYTKDQLVKDAGLEVPLPELRGAEDIPNIVDLQHQHQQLVKLRQQHCSGDEHASYRLMLENGIRRLDRLIKEFSVSQLDATPVVRLSDDLLVNLDHVLNLAPLPLILQEINDRIEILSAKQKECMDIREQALEDGEMHIAERETFRLVDLSEELAAAQCEKIRLLSQSAEENNVISNVRKAFSEKAAEKTSHLENETNDLRTRCETDLARLYKLKESVDGAESQMREKWETECSESNTKLGNIHTRQEESWNQIEALVKGIRQLESERHIEVKRRMDEKVKDETRRIEYERFCGVANHHSSMLDRTIKNCETNIHCAKLMAELLQSGFYTVEKDLAEKRSALEGSLLDAHKSHLEIFRSLLFTLADLEYKKERRMEEVGNSIQAAHIQQELCSDSLNPNAKKFSDAKKDLLRVRDEIELEVSDVRDRMHASIEQFKPTEEALLKRQVPHIHPVEEMEERRLATRAKMVEYRAMSLGNVSSAPLKQELDTLKKNLDESRRVIANASRNSTRASTNNSSFQ